MSHESGRSTPLAAILEAAQRLLGARGIELLSLPEIALALGVPLGLLRYHFRSKEHLLVEAWRTTFRRVNERFEQRFERGERGLGTAMDALDALWEAVRDMHGWAPFMVQTMALAARDRALGDRLEDFNAEVLTRVELGLMRAFSDHMDQLVLPPDRLSRAVRTGIYGLIVELSAARTEAQVALVDETYRDVRALLERVVLETSAAPVPH